MPSRQYYGPLVLRNGSVVVGRTSIPRIRRCSRFHDTSRRTISMSMGPGGRQPARSASYSCLLRRVSHCAARRAVAAVSRMYERPHPYDPLRLPDAHLSSLLQIAARLRIALPQQYRPPAAPVLVLRRPDHPEMELGLRLTDHIRHSLRGDRDHLRCSRRRQRLPSSQRPR